MKKKTLLLVLSIIIVLVVLSFPTYSMFYRQNKLDNSENYKTGVLSIVLDNDEEGLGDTVTLNNSYPVEDEVGENSTPYRFKITNNGNLDYMFDLTLTRSGTINGNYVKVKVDNKDTVALTNTSTIVATGLKLFAGESMIIEVRMWLDINTPNSEIGKTLSASLSASGEATIIESLDKSGANAPKLVEGLIPVMYKDNNWVKADSTNTDENNQWYDYNSKMWANAVLVSSTNRTIYVNANAGIVIPESEVLAYYVWIPRYKYKVWNITKSAQAESNYGYNAYTEGIDIVFETGTATTGTITCTYDFSLTATDTIRNETCTGANNDYYTHPAFWWDIDGDSVHDTGEELEGIWVGKFEISSETPTATDGGGESTTLTVRIKPNVISWRDNPSTNFYKVIYDMQTSNNIYGLSTDRTNTDSHMMKNMEWGAVAYLTNSKYGRCSNNSCTEVAINSNSSYYTGGNAYTTNVNQSTTGNIYGIYDMSGGATEYVMGNMSFKAGSYTYYMSSGGSNFSYSTATAKYIDTYAKGSTYNDQTAFNRARLGDATGEVTLAVGSASSWYSDYSGFVYSSNSWFERGGNYTNISAAGPFDFNWQYGGASGGYSARAALIGL